MRCGIDAVFWAALGVEGWVAAEAGATPLSVAAMQTTERVVRSGFMDLPVLDWVDRCAADGVQLTHL
jgi:hypothetical protein